MSHRLVLVEDHHALRQGLELLLRGEGFDVAGAAGSLAEAEALVAAAAPDVVLADVRLGDGCGIELTRRLVDADPEARVLLYTGCDDVELVVRGLEAGARGHLLKDGGPGELLDALLAVIDGAIHVDPRMRPALAAHQAGERLPALSRREREVIDLLSHGLTGEQVAERLVLSSETIKTHVRNAMGKLEANTRAHAIALALRGGHISGPAVALRRGTRA